MARGWESKSVEEQMQAAEERKAAASRIALTAVEVERQKRREALELTKVRVERDLAAATNERYKLQLQAALEHVRKQLADI